MTITLGSNIASLRGIRQLNRTGSDLEKSYERLSSGQRINSAADDAAGIAIADSLEADSRVFNQGIRNLNQGLSVLNIAESAMDSISHILTRVEELAEQASNGIYTLEQRTSLDNEAQALSAELDRIIETTEFNGEKLFEDRSKSIRIQAGYGLDGSIEVVLEKPGVLHTVGTGTFQTATTILSNFQGSNQNVHLADINNDGTLDLVTAQNNRDDSVFIGNGDGTFISDVDLGIGGTGGVHTRSVFADFTGDGYTDIVRSDRNATTWIQVYEGSASGTFTALPSVAAGTSGFKYLAVGDVDNDSDLDFVVKSNYGSGSIAKNNGDGTFTSTSLYTPSGGTDVELSDVDNDGDLDYVISYNNNEVRLYTNDGTGTMTYDSSLSQSARGSIESMEVGDINNDGDVDIIVNQDDGVTSVFLGQGSGNFAVATTFASSGESRAQLLDLNGDDNLDLITMSGNNIISRLGNGDGTFQTSQSFSVGSGLSTSDIVVGDINGDGAVDVIASNTTNPISILLGETQEVLTSRLSVDLTTQESARDAIGTARSYLESVSALRGKLGSSASRINIAIDGLSTAVENFTSAESQIRDVDIASESASLTRNKLLQQSAIAILAQANLQPQLVLSLLG